MGAPSSAEGEARTEVWRHTNTQKSVFWGRRCMGSQGHPGLQVLLRPSPVGSTVRWYLQALSLTRAFPAGSSQSPSPGSIPSCQQDHTCHLLQLITSFSKMQFFIDSLYLLSGPQLPWSASFQVSQHFRGVDTTGRRSVYTCLLSQHPPSS